jgi:hypothetical protein
MENNKMILDDGLTCTRCKTDIRNRLLDELLHEFNITKNPDGIGKMELFHYTKLQCIVEKFRRYQRG